MNLYHYTNSTGLKGIIESKKLFLTHFAFMNDQKELVHGINIITGKWKKAFLKDMDKVWSDTKGLEFKSDFPNEILQTFISDRKKQTQEIFLKKFNSFVDSLRKDSNIFSCSFSQNGDLLSQWRGYGGLETGYCIEFDEEILLSSIHKNFKNEDTFAYGLSDCIYDEQRKENIAEQLSKKLNEFSEKNDKEFLIILESAMEAIKFKDKSFSEENEKRIIVSYNPNHSGMKFRERKGIIVPYVEYDFPPEAIRSIKVGPSNQQDMAVEGLSKYIHSVFGNNSPKIFASEIPFRVI